MAYAHTHTHTHTHTHVHSPITTTHTAHVCMCTPCVLQIAVMNKRGPYKDTYQLKKEYQLNEIEGEGQQ